MQATIYEADDSGVTTFLSNTLTGSVACKESSSPVLSKPTPHNGVTILEVNGGTTLYTIPQYSISNAGFTLCGFDRYEVNFSEGASSVNLANHNPHSSDSCTSVS